MFLPSNSPQPPNGTTPIDSRMVLRDMIYQARLAGGVERAYRAVYGNCTPPGSYAAAGVNLMQDIAQSPSPASVVSGAAGASSLVSGGPVDLTEVPVTTIPLNGSSAGGASGYPLPAPYNLTTDQGMGVPVLPASVRIPPRPVQTCPANTTRSRRRVSVPASGLAPGWGDAFAQLPLPKSAAASGFLGWIQSNPLMALGVAVAGAALLSSGGRK